MNSYKYIARDFSGQRSEGLKQAVSANSVLDWLREQDFTPISVSELSTQTKKTRRSNCRKRIKSADLAALCWQLTTMVEGGVPVTGALETISEDIDNLQLQAVLRQVVEKMHRGENLSDSLAEFPNVFNQLTCAMILAGETSGNMAGALKRLAQYYDNRDKLKKKVQGAMAYPVFVFGFIILIVVFIMTFIIPRFKTIFDQIGGELPAFTRGFMGFYDFICVNILYILGLVMLLVILTVLISKTRKGHYTFCKIALGFPLFGKILSQAFIAMFCRTMSTLVSAGVSVLEVFDILSVMTRNDIIKAAVVKTRENIIEGANISSSLNTSGFFPNMVVKMVQVGEESGSLSKVLDRTADYYERKVDATVTALMSLLEPVMIVSVGAIVLVIVLALYLPIFTMA